MIEHPTVFVLGAGASMDFGLPSGRDLVEDVLAGLGPGGPIRKTMQRIGFNLPKLEEFARELKASDVYSVDFFLEHRQEFLELGKTAIGLALAPKEAPGVFAQVRDHSWYRYLFSHLTEGTPIKQFTDNKVSFVTFNYDRSLEHYLETRMRGLYGEDIQMCRNVLAGLSIVHVHGSLGPLPGWADGSGKRAYTPQIGDDWARELPGLIQVVFETDQQTHAYRSAAGMIAKAGAVYFLGCHYHSQNMERLGISALQNFNTRAFGSAYRMETAERRRVTNKWGINLGNPDADALTYLRSSVELA